jgi:hypothetical protein
MLARLDALPRGDYSYEVKWDGFRAIVATEDEVQVRSRRGWIMTELLPELNALPRGLVLDGYLVAFGDDGRPSFPLLSRRILHKLRSIPVVLMIFDGLLDQILTKRSPGAAIPADSLASSIRLPYSSSPQPRMTESIGTADALRPRSPRRKASSASCGADPRSRMTRNVGGGESS